MTAHIPMQVPDHFSRADIGAYMRELRLHYGLSEQDVSERLHIRAKYVSAIETAQFDLMPGKAYARGYVHNYAEFLGLDAEQIVERCFGGEMAREVQPHSIPESSDWYKRNKRYGGILAVLLLLGGLFYFATQGDGDGGQKATATAGVEDVPEEYLAGMRNRLMPTAENFDCIGEDSALGCFYAQRLTREFITPAAVPDMASAPGDAAAMPDDKKNAADAQEKTAPEPVKKEASKPAPKKAEEKPAAKSSEIKPAAKKPVAAPTPAPVVKQPEPALAAPDTKGDE